MLNTRSQIHLGASMYVPATQPRSALVAIGNGEKYDFLRSVIFCLEDAVRIDQLESAINNLRKALPFMETNRGPMRFIRVRNPDILGKCLRMKGIQNIDGFVLPKITADNLQYYLAHLTEQDSFKLMPTLETKEVFNSKEMGKLRDLLLKDERARDRILCLRIGGNDLLHCLKVRRNPKRTIYDTPVGEVIKRLAGEFIPFGFGLSAPVCECTDNPEVLTEEVELDLMQGLFGKTAIHPTQIQLIENGFRVDPRDLEEARKIILPGAPAVFKMNGRMCEPTTHTRWAVDIITRADIYGQRS
ncbi:MAG: HpcH/HpaI aldolase/citrate lyase family protein [Leptolyngbya sp.]|nr:HpcH/HpaI aldolase/citrate lyase family protein [Candidatus Melainabacteria bacterium]